MIKCLRSDKPKTIHRRKLSLLSRSGTGLLDWC